MKPFKFSKIISILVSLILLITQVPTAYALYSPLLNQEAATIKKHIFDSRKAHGTGKWMDVLSKAEDDAKKRNRP